MRGWPGEAVCLCKGYTVTGTTQTVDGERSGSVVDGKGEDLPMKAPEEEFAVRHTTRPALFINTNVGQHSSTVVVKYPAKGRTTTIRPRGGKTSYFPIYVKKDIQPHLKEEGLKIN